MMRLGFALLGFALFLAPVHGQTPEQRQATLAYVRNLQTPSGGFRPSASQEMPSLRATSTALRALKYFGQPLEDMKSAREFFRRCYQPELGAFVDRPEATTPDVATTAIGLMAGIELKMPVARYSPAIVHYLTEHSREFPDIRIAAAALESIQTPAPRAAAWLKVLAGMRNADGTYGKGEDLARETGSVVVTVLRLGGNVEARDKVLATMRASQRADGAFGKGGTKTSDLESTYRIMRAFMMLKEKPKDSTALRGFIAKCRNSDGGYGVEPGQPSTIAGTYYAGIILHWLDELK